MFNKNSFFKKKLFYRKRLGDFPGGIYPEEMKVQSNCTPIDRLALSKYFIIVLKQHIGDTGEICITPGDKVLRGQALTFGNEYMLPVHASTSGIIEKIEPHITAHPAGISELSIFLRSDGKDTWIDLDPQPNYHTLDRQEIIKRIHNAGIAGLGGAVFPTALKLSKGMNKVHTLIINAAECEPYITADDRLMQDYATEVVEGCRILAWILQVDKVLIGIENNKSKAIVALQKVLNGYPDDIQVCVIPTKYPSGGAKQLIKILTGLEVPHDRHSIDIGILVQNVGTSWAIKRAIVDGEPMTERVVTITGGGIDKPRNIWGRIGTPIRDLLNQVGYCFDICNMVIMGGPLMGFNLPSLDIPIVKSTNCILVPSAQEFSTQSKEKPCIRCGNCADVCPINLLPQQLYWYSSGADHDKSRIYNIDDCIECGACAYVCPSKIPLVLYYRQEKAKLRKIDSEKKHNNQSKTRFEARMKRLKYNKSPTLYFTDNNTDILKNDKQNDRQVYNTNVKNIRHDNNENDSQHNQLVSRKDAVEIALARAKARKKLRIKTEE